LLNIAHTDTEGLIAVMKAALLQPKLMLLLAMQVKIVAAKKSVHVG
jgi:hypothetical protein